MVMNKLIRGIPVIIAILILVQICSCEKTGDSKMEIKREIYGTLQDGRDVYLFTLKTSDDSELRLMNFGATVLSLKVPDRSGKMENVILGYNKIKDYENIRNFYGAIVGHEGLPYNYRYALCLETQHYPDSPNQESFPSTVLNPDEIYKSTTIYKFSVK